MARDEREFQFNGMPVGYFETDLPRASGRYRYVPYRGPGHYEMQIQLRARGAARCCYDAEDLPVWFTVSACPEYGVLELADFENARPL
jgi:hypothetical protein